VPSPRPIELVDATAITALLDAVTSCSPAAGGGVPVACDADGTLIGVEAVIDKDHTAALLGFVF